MGSIAELKRSALEQLLQQEDFVLLVINPTMTGVKLPSPLIEARQPVPIHLGFRMAVPVPDLVIDDSGITGTLSFDRTPFACHFPWPALMQVSVGDEHLVWVVPVDEGELSEPATDERKMPKSKAHLRLI